MRNTHPDTGADMPVVLSTSWNVVDDYAPSQVVTDWEHQQQHSTSLLPLSWFPEPDLSTSGTWSSFVQKTKTRLYNVYKSPPRELPRFSKSRMYLLGGCFPSPGGLDASLLKDLPRFALLVRGTRSLLTLDLGPHHARCFLESDLVEWTCRSFAVSAQQALEAVDRLVAHKWILPVPNCSPFFTCKSSGKKSRRSLLSSLGGGGGGGRNDNDAAAAAALADEVARQSAVQDFLAQFHSLPWMTYRKNYLPIYPTQFTTDMGWGCMLRTGQMLLCTAFMRHFLGRSWRYGSAASRSKAYKMILWWFADVAGPQHPYSIHNIAHCGTLFGKQVGEWFQPSLITRVLRLLVRKHSPGNLTVYAPRDRVIYRANVEALCAGTPPGVVCSPPLARRAGDDAWKSASDGCHPRWRNSSNSDVDIQDVPFAASGNKRHSVPPVAWRPVIILIPLMLGVNTISDVYYRPLCEFFAWPSCIGIAGGKPNESVFFVGAQDSNVFYLDPHYVQDAVDMDSSLNFDANSFHCAIPQMIPISELDPSMVVGFYCRDRQQFNGLCSRLAALNEAHPESTLVSIGDEDPCYHKSANSPPEEDPLAHIRFPNDFQNK